MIIVTGMTYAGKTTIVNRLKGTLKLTDVQKYTTSNLDFMEQANSKTTSVSQEEFEALQASGFFGWVKTNPDGTCEGIAKTEFADDTKIMEVDFDTYKSMEGVIPTSAKTVYVEADSRRRYERAVAKGVPETKVFDAMHADNFKEPGVARGIRVNNSISDGGEFAATNIAYSLGEYKEFGIVYATRIPPATVVKENEFTAPKLCRFLGFEEEIVARARENNDINTPEGAAAANAYYIEEMKQFACIKYTPMFYEDNMAKDPKDVVVMVGGEHYHLFDGDKPNKAPYVKTLTKKESK